LHTRDWRNGNRMDLSISIVSWNTRDLLDQCLESIYGTTSGVEFEVIVVDNASSDGSPDMVRENHSRVRLIQNKDNVGFSTANNQALAVSSGRHFLLLNPDTVVHANALKRMTEFLDNHDRAGAVGPLVLNDDGTLQYSWAKFPTLWSEAMGRLDRRISGVPVTPSTADEVRKLHPFEADWVGGCCLMVKREAIDQIGPMDESLFMYCEETDWCLRLAEGGWGVWLESSAEVVHYGGRSSKQVSRKSVDILCRSKSIFFAKHHGQCQGLLLGALLALRSTAARIVTGRVRGKAGSGA
jgi:N-acetylglucosaminyl-diphospho-decaprenol L-rhamnosyltransferase